MSKILLSNRYQGKPLQILRNAVGEDFDLEILDALSIDELKDKIDDADYLLVSGRMKISREVLSCAKRLKMIQRTGVGLDNLDLDYIRESGIPLYVNQGVNSTSVAEYTIYLILASLRRAYFINRQIREGIWRKQETGLTTHELYGKTVGIVGMGNIGRKVARMLSVFGVQILYYSVPRLEADEEAELSAEYHEFDGLLRSVDILTLHCPASEHGPMLGPNEIASMKDGAIIVNTARGGLIDMQAMVDALQAGKLSAVGIDVYDVEPIPESHRLLSQDNAVLSPHIAGVTYEAFRGMMVGAVDNMRSFERGDYSSILQSRFL